MPTIQELRRELADAINSKQYLDDLKIMHESGEIDDEDSLEDIKDELRRVRSWISELRAQLHARGALPQARR